MPAFTLQCLGLPRLLNAGGHEIRIRVRKHMAVLVYLAVEHRTSHRRDRLVELLWPRAPGEQARQSFATALSVLRSRMGADVIESTRDHVRLRPGHLALDLDRLEAGDILGDDFTPPLEVDGFLSGFELEEAPEFDIWRDAQQARLLPSIQTALHALIDLARRTANLTHLGRYADRLMLLNDLSEEAVRARMEAHALSGDRITALRIFEEWSERLQAELGAKPAPLIEGMATRLRRRGWERPADSNVPTVRTEQWRDRRFIGRSKEYRVLYEMWERVNRAEPRHGLIFGDSGVGKTTLADRLGTAIALEGATVARARCFELERGIPYAAIGSAIETLLDRPGAAGTSPAGLAEIGRIVPAVRRKYPDLPPPQDIQGESARIRFAEATLELLTCLMEEHPVIVVVDDFHMADEASLAVLHLIMRRVEDRPFMVLLTSRTELPEGSTHAVRIRDNAQFLRLTSLDLGPMDQLESEALFDALVQQSPSRPSPTERRAILQASGGYPLALELFLKDWEEHGQRSIALSVGAMTADVHANPEQTYQRLAEGILRDLDPTSRMVFQVATLLDRRMNEFDMYRVVDVPLAQTMASLSHLVGRRALRDAGAGLEFVNPAIRAHGYLSIPASLRRTLHGFVADRLLERSRAGEGIPGLEIAWHCIRADRAAEAAPYLLSGASEAMNAGASHEAELALRSGMSHLGDDRRDRGKLLLGEVLQELGRWSDSLEFLQAVELAADPDIVLRAKFLKVLATQHLGQLEKNDQLALLEMIRSHVAHEGTESVRVLAASVGALICEHLSDNTLSLSILQASHSVSDSGLTHPDLARFLLAKAMLHYQLRDTASSLEMLREAREIISKHQINSTLAVRMLNGFGALACSGGNYSEALESYERAHTMSSKLDNDTLTAYCAANVSLCHGRLGFYQEQATWAEKALSRGPHFVDAGYYVPAHTYLGYAAAILGRRNQAHDVIHSLQQQLPSLREEWTRQRADLACADIHLLLDERRRALAIAREAMTKHDGPKALSLWGTYARWRAVLALEEGRPEGARTELKRMLDVRSRLDAIDRVEILAALGLLEALSPGLQSELQAGISSLPPAVAVQLGKLGLLMTS